MELNQKLAEKVEEWKAELKKAFDKAEETTKEFGLFNGNHYYSDQSSLLTIARNDEYPKGFRDLFFNGANWEVAQYHTDNTDYSWNFHTVYKLTKHVYLTGLKPKEVSVYVKFYGAGRSYDGDEYLGWNFVEPKVKTVEVWE